MRPARQKWIARAAVSAVAIIGGAMAAGAVASASGQTDVSSTQVTSTDISPVPCTTNKCKITITSPSPSNTNSFQVKAVELPSAGRPRSAGPTLADKGTLTPRTEVDNPLKCSGYTASDPTSYQFYLGDSTLGNVFYIVTYTVENIHSGPAQICLGARFKFTTKSGARARSAILPNGLRGRVGLLPLCSKDQIGKLVACLRSRNTTGSSTVLIAQVPAIGGDPWVRS